MGQKIATIAASVAETVEVDASVAIGGLCRRLCIVTLHDGPQVCLRDSHRQILAGVEALVGGLQRGVQTKPSAFRGAGST